MKFRNKRAEAVGGTRLIESDRTQTSPFEPTRGRVPFFAALPSSSLSLPPSPSTLIVVIANVLLVPSPAHLPSSAILHGYLIPSAQRRASFAFSLTTTPIPNADLQTEKSRPHSALRRAPRCSKEQPAQGGLLPGANRGDFRNLRVSPRHPVVWQQLTPSSPRRTALYCREYAARMSFYRLKQFQCELTGKSGLDYFQAVESEKHEATTLHTRFSEPLKPVVLKAVQWRTSPFYSQLSLYRRLNLCTEVMGRLDHLVEAVYDRFKDRYFQHESM